MDDLIYEEDYQQDVNAAEQAVRVASADICGTGAVILEGLTVEDSTATGKYKINPGRARDMDKRHIIINSVEDNLDPATEDITETNYIAVRHAWSDSSAGNAVKTGRPYNRVRADSYEIDISTTRHDEAKGWVNLATATGTWPFREFEVDYPNRSRGPARDVVFWTFTRESEVESGAPAILMEHHGIDQDVFAVPFDLAVHRVTFMAAQPADSDTLIRVLRNGVSVNDDGFVVYVGESLPRSFYSDSALGTFAVNDTLQVALNNMGISSGPEKISVVITGYRMGD
ncbi:MAG: hypothetical protein PVH29_09980 [Candidatus Zixiibacteriota bacterium]